ncbi:50S ribosomal protein L25/general stress protein Ctc [Candidatus Thiothrix anitrata]|jgi:large subunit ribosomal protein L25|uniref:Large ribosomal subunit protein bL25 n=1 Tax=Candidatus Thiothrix anitrata TaxID=2823902 RepID=A0ABX7X0V3_9GAMM|nr:50S ribosomal protein L25/general stress protein Ctc [Candidatus Thiothrix anitrata]QTR49326.1 50S ribosomal protein L25/general stress protein Ctc [Candidatus Thiothrix anitrata]
MSKQYVLQAQVRELQGKGASRRLRHTGLIPAVIYGAGGEAQSISLRHNEMIRNLQEEGFYSQIITVDFGDRKEQVILRDLQRHPAKPIVMHADLQRIRDDEEIKVLVALHFINGDVSKGVKEQGGKVSHVVSEVEVSCLPKNLPEFIEIDMIDVEKGQILHLSDLKLPEGVTLPQLALGSDHDNAIAAIH